MAQEDSGGKLIWFVAGAAIGAAVALLYAPQTGEETRRYLGKKTKEGADAVAETSREMYDRGRDLIEKGRRIADEAADIFERGRDIVDKAASALNEQVQKAV